LANRAATQYFLQSLLTVAVVAARGTMLAEQD
jgi:hypothetical protein